MGSPWNFKISLLFCRRLPCEDFPIFWNFSEYLWTILYQDNIAPFRYLVALNFIKNHDICPTYDPYDMDYSNIFSNYHFKNSISFSWRYRTQRQQKPSRQPMPRGGKIPYPRLPFFKYLFMKWISREIYLLVHFCWHVTWPCTITVTVSLKPNWVNLLTNHGGYYGQTSRASTSFR